MQHRFRYDLHAVDVVGVEVRRKRILFSVLFEDGEQRIGIGHPAFLAEVLQRYHQGSFAVGPKDLHCTDFPVGNHAEWVRLCSFFEQLVDLELHGI